MRWASGDGVSPSAVRSGGVWQAVARRGPASHGAAWFGLRWQHGGPTGLPCRLHWWTGCGSTRHGGAWRVECWPGVARRGKGHRRWHGGLRPSLPPSQRVDGARPGLPRQGVVRFGTARSALARAADSSTELLRRLPAALFRGQTRRGLAWRAWDGRGCIWQGAVSRGEGRLRRQGEAGQPAFSCSP